MLLLTVLKWTVGAGGTPHLLRFVFGKNVYIKQL